ncbi:MAG TPA: hypothetical protein VH764_11410 [Gemmatimonadales bacterium]|jgi:hypothetical protein
MFPRWPEALRVAAVSVALTVSTMSLPAQAQDSQGKTTVQEMRPTSSGYAGAAEGLEIYYEVYGEGAPIVVLAGGLMPISTTTQITGPLSDTRQVIAIDLEGHGRTGLRDTPMSQERNGDDRPAAPASAARLAGSVRSPGRTGVAGLRYATARPGLAGSGARRALGA